jgi:hypothetical protein
MRIRKGSRICYADWDGKDCFAVVESHGWHKQRRVVNLDNGQWCYRTDVRYVIPKNHKGESHADVSSEGL